MEKEPVDLKLGLGALIQKHGWRKVLLIALSLLAFAGLVVAFIVGYEALLERVFGKESIGAALGIPFAAMVFSGLGAYLANRGKKGG